jgi:hypothetical protein
MKQYNMIDDNKKRLFEIFQKVNKINLKESYGEFLTNFEEPTININPHDIIQVSKLYTHLMSDGIKNIYNYLKPHWMVDVLEINGYVAEDPQLYRCFFTEKGKEKFPTPQDLQFWLVNQWYGYR